MFVLANPAANGSGPREHERLGLEGPCAEEEINRSWSFNIAGRQFLLRVFHNKTSKLIHPPLSNSTCWPSKSDQQFATPLVWLKEKYPNNIILFCPPENPVSILN